MCGAADGAGVHRRSQAARGRGAESRVRRSASEARRALDQLRTEASRLKARKDSLEEILSHRAYTTESVKRLFTAVERGQAEDFKPAGVLADFVEVDAGLRKGHRRFPARRARVRGRQQLERSRARHRPDAHGSGRPRHVPGASGAGRAVAFRRRNWARPTGIVGRLSDHLRFTNGLTQPRPHDLLPRLAPLLPGRRSRRGAAVWRWRIPMLLPASRRRQLPRPCGERRQEDRQRTAGAEARTARADRRVSRRSSRAVDETAAQARSSWSARSPALDRRSGSGCAALQQKQEKEALALDHEIARWPRSSRGRSRESRWRGWSWSGCGEEGSVPANSSERDQRALDEKETARVDQEQALEQSRADFEELQARSATSWPKSTRRCAPIWPDSKSGAGPSAPRRPGWKRRSPKLAAPASRDHGRDGTAGCGAGAAAGRQHRAGPARQ